MTQNRCQNDRAEITLLSATLWAWTLGAWAIGNPEAYINIKGFVWLVMGMATAMGAVSVFFLALGASELFIKKARERAWVRKDLKEVEEERRILQ